MKKTISIVLIVILVLGAFGLVDYWYQQNKINNLQHAQSDLQTQLNNAKSKLSQIPNTAYKSGKGVDITVYTPPSKGKVTSPVYVVGQVPGNWSFEAQFPIELRDSSGKVIAKTAAKLVGDWMTDSKVPFVARLEFTGPQSGSGTVVLMKDNPSGQSSNDDSVSIPVEF